LQTCFPVGVFFLSVRHNIQTPLVVFMSTPIGMPFKRRMPYLAERTVSDFSRTAAAMTPSTQIGDANIRGSRKRRPMRRH
jgi:hypothetical protein